MSDLKGRGSESEDVHTTSAFIPLTKSHSVSGPCQVWGGQQYCRAQGFWFSAAPGQGCRGPLRGPLPCLKASLCGYSCGSPVTSIANVPRANERCCHRSGNSRLSHVALDMTSVNSPFAFSFFTNMQTSWKSGIPSTVGYSLVPSKLRVFSNT